MEWLKRIIVSFFDFLQGIVVFMAILVMIYLFIISPQEINGASMEPNFYNRELILTNKIIYKLKPPKRGDVVIFKSPKNKEIDYIKRVIAVPGETIKLENSTFYINGQKLEEPYLPSTTYTSGGSCLTEGAQIIIPEGKYFLAGDNRAHSSDSREFCPVPLVDFIGQALLRYWPVTKTGIIPHPSYQIDQ